MVNLIYGANFSIAKALMPQYIKPFGFIWLRVSFGLVCYALLYFIFIKERVRQKDVLRIIACGFFGIAANQLLFFKGISITTSINGSLLMITTPIITFVLSSIILNHRFTLTNASGILAGAVGVFIIIGGIRADFSSATAFGDLMVILNAISYSIYLVIAKPLIQRYHPLTVIFWCFFVGWFFVSAAGMKEAIDTPWTSIPPSLYWNLGFVLFFATFVVYLFNIASMKMLNPSIVSSYIYTQPLFAILIALFFTSEKLNLYTFVGGIMIVGGLMMINKSKKTKSV
jgi:drug/metabolite transporter (DMT)-like permease